MLGTTVKERLKWNLIRRDEAKLAEWNKIKASVLELVAGTSFLHLFGDIELCEGCLKHARNAEHECVRQLNCGCGSANVFAPKCVVNLKCDWCTYREKRLLYLTDNV